MDSLPYQRSWENPVLEPYHPPTYPGSADDSGFVEMYPPVESEDNDIWATRREYLMQSPNIASAGFCSTPNTGTLPNSVTRFNDQNSSPVTIRQYQTSPFSTGSYFPAHNNQPKIIFNTATEADFENQEVKHLLAEHTETESIDETSGPAERKNTSDFSRGHSTIASLLNSLPLNSAKVENEITQRSELKNGFVSSKSTSSGELVAKVAPFKNTSNGDFEPSKISSSGECHPSKSTISEISTTRNVTETTGVPKNDERVKDAEITKVATDNDNAYQNANSSETVFSENNSYDTSNRCSQKNSCLFTGIYDSQDTQCVDGNNNFQLIQKYSDISDACSSEAGTTTEVSSSDEEQPEKGEINQIPATTTRSRRKSKCPRRSAVKEDPRFKGVTVWLQTSFRNGQSSLHISAFYSNVKLVSPSRTSPAYQSRCSTPRCFRFSDQESNSPAYITKDTHGTVKTCTSCKTRRTPLWRDADDGTPLCNACGIRYKKYRLRCSKCWHIPKKEVKTYPNCPVCGASLRYSFHKKTW